MNKLIVITLIILSCSSGNIRYNENCFQIGMSEETVLKNCGKPYRKTVYMDKFGTRKDFYYRKDSVFFEDRVVIEDGIVVGVFLY